MSVGLECQNVFILKQEKKRTNVKYFYKTKHYKMDNFGQYGRDYSDTNEVEGALLMLGGQGSRRAATLPGISILPLCDLMCLI
jgi:hypothetical protein